MKLEEPADARRDGPRPRSFAAPAGERVTPQLSERYDRLIRGVALLALLYGVYWIVWRWTETLNTDPAAVVPSVLLLLAETWAVIGMGLFVFLVWKLEERDPGSPLPGVSVDVFITAYDEPLEVLRRTAIGAKAIRYPHRTYILDDGKREDLKLMAEELGIGYLRRKGNQNAKAGNLNHALSVTRGEFILQLDADHVPLPNMLDRLLGYFRDPRVAVVQSPQEFYNTDSFTHVVNDEGRRLWEENRIFYSLIQPGRDHWNASFFCGSCGILRRSALEAVGGFATETIIEDQETTLRLHGRGWRSVYHPEVLAYGLAPVSAGAYHVQRLRWGQGAMQLLRRLNPLTYPGLTAAQRLCYFAGTATYIEGYQKAIFYLMPLFFFFTGILPIDVEEGEFLVRLIPYLILVVAAFELMARGTGYVLISERFTMVRFFTYILAVTGYFARGKLKFNVTPKGVAGVPFRTYAPQLVLLLLSLAAPLWATLAYYRGWIDYRADGWGSIAFVLNGLWALWNLYFAAYVVRHSLVMRQQRHDHRFLDQLTVRFAVLGEGSTLKFRHALTHDLNPAGLAFRTTTRLPEQSRLLFDLPLSTGRRRVVGSVVHEEEHAARYGTVYRYGVEFEHVPLPVRDAIELHCTHHAVPIWRNRYRQSIDLLTRTAEVFRNARAERRNLVQLPAQVSVQRTEDAASEAVGLAILEETSRGGARLLLDQPIEPGRHITFEVPGTTLSGSGVVRFVNALETPLATRFAIGVQLAQAAPKSRGWTGRWLPDLRKAGV